MKIKTFVQNNCKQTKLTIIAKFYVFKIFKYHPINKKLNKITSTINFFNILIYYLEDDVEQ